MKVTRSILAVVILAFLAALVTLAANRGKHSYATRSLTAAPRKAVKPASLAPHCDYRDDTRNAQCEFEKLTNATAEWTAERPPSSTPVDPTNTQTLPLWTHWTSKCLLGLNPCSPQTVAFFEQAGSQKADLASMELPAQFALQLQSSALDAHISGKHSSSSQELASVLFSPEIVSAAKQLNNAAALDRQLANPGPDDDISTVLTEDSTVTKLIWEVVLNKNSNFPAYVYEQDRIPPLSPSHGSELVPLPQWPTKYIIDGAENSPCSPSGSLPEPGGHNPPTISVNCFFHYTVKSTDPGWNQLSSDLQNVVISDSSTAFPGSAPEAIVILVGAHVIRFDKQHKFWQWMTFYWTKDSNGLAAWKNPWKHYHMKTTTVVQQGQTLTHEPLANPYLEGHINNNGMDTNCVSCHSLAAYTPSGGKSIQALALINGTPCSPKTGTPCYPATERAASASNPPYFANAIRTHFLWSIATNPCLPQPNEPSDVLQLCPASGRASQSGKTAQSLAGHH